MRGNGAARRRLAGWTLPWVLLAGACATGSPPANAPSTAAPAVAKGEKGDFVKLVTSKGDIVFRLLPAEAPETVRSFKALARGEKEWTDPATGTKTRRPLYDGTRFFQVIPGFIIRGGDPLNDGSGGPGFTFEDEFFPGRGFSRAGLLAMANSGPNTNGSQFFITLAPAPWLDGKHTIFGEAVKGLEVAERLAAVPRIQSDPATGKLVDRPVKPQVLKRVEFLDRF